MILPTLVIPPKAGISRFQRVHLTYEITAIAGMTAKDVAA